MKIGLVLEGGGNRAIYTSGVLDAFMDQGITFPYVIGVSAGSCNAVSYIGKCRGRQHDISIQYSGDKRFMSLENMIKNGEFLNGEWLFGELSYDLSPLDQEAYDRANTTLCVVVTNALTGKAEYMYPKDFHKRGCPILRASCALPGRWRLVGATLFPLAYSYYGTQLVYAHVFGSYLTLAYAAMGGQAVTEFGGMVGAAVWACLPRLLLMAAPLVAFYLLRRRRMLPVGEGGYGREGLALLAAGATPQEARSVLPNSLKTEVVMTANLREWRHFFKLRTAPAAHPQMQEVAIPLLRRFQELVPVVFDDIKVEVPHEKS